MSWRIFMQLIRRDLLIFKKEYPGKILDILITFTVWIIVFGYFVPKMGTSSGYGPFIMVGAIASFGIFEIIGQAGMVIQDIKGDRTISYLLLLPISSNTIFCYQAISWAIQSLFTSIPLYFVGKGVFWDQLSLQSITWYQLAIALITINLFLGFFSLWVVCILHRVRDLTRIYFRFLSPLFIFGCYFFTWKIAYGLSPWIGYATCLDPFSFIMEMIRATILGPGDYIPFWASFAALWGYILVLGFHATKRLKHILDCL